MTSDAPPTGHGQALPGCQYRIRLTGFRCSVKLSQDFQCSMTQKNNQEKPSRYDSPLNHLCHLCWRLAQVSSSPSNAGNQTFSKFLAQWCFLMRHAPRLGSNTHPGNCLPPLVTKAILSVRISSPKLSASAFKSQVLRVFRVPKR